MQGKASPMIKNAIETGLRDRSPIPDRDAIAATAPPATTNAAPDIWEKEYLLNANGALFLVHINNSINSYLTYTCNL